MPVGYEVRLHVLTYIVHFNIDYNYFSQSISKKNVITKNDVIKCNVVNENVVRVPFYVHQL